MKKTFILFNLNTTEQIELQFVYTISFNDSVKVNS